MLGRRVRQKRFSHFIHPRTKSVKGVGRDANAETRQRRKTPVLRLQFLLRGPEV